jgi:hypothetical protein
VTISCQFVPGFTYCYGRLPLKAGRGFLDAVSGTTARRTLVVARSSLAASFFVRKGRDCGSAVTPVLRRLLHG